MPPMVVFTFFLRCCGYGWWNKRVRIDGTQSAPVSALPGPLLFFWDRAIFEHRCQLGRELFGHYFGGPLRRSLGSLSSRLDDEELAYIVCCDQPYQLT